MISVFAFLLGFVAAYVHVFYFASLFEPVLKGWAVLYPRFELTPVIDGLQVVTLLFFTVFPYAAATLVPIWRAAITDPDAVMRHERTISSACDCPDMIQLKAIHKAFNQGRTTPSRRCAASICTSRPGR